jgi:hypothetical protein
LRVISCVGHLRPSVNFRELSPIKSRVTTSAFNRAVVCAGLYSLQISYERACLSVLATSIEIYESLASSLFNSFIWLQKFHVRSYVCIRSQLYFLPNFRCRVAITQPQVG